MNLLVYILMFIAGAAIGGIIGYQHAIIKSLKAQLGIEENIKTKTHKTILVGLACCVAWSILICIASDRGETRTGADIQTENAIAKAEVVQSDPRGGKLPVEATIEKTGKYFDVPLDHDLQDYIFALCEERGLDPAIVIAMIRKESTYRAGAIGDSGSALGLMQIWPRWHQKRMDEFDCQDLLDPYQNVTVGIDIIADLNDKGKGIEWALMAYNAGGSVANRNYAEGTVTYYARTVLEYASELTYA